MSSDGAEGMSFGLTSTFTATVAHASVKREALTKMQIEEQQKKLLEAQVAKGTAGGKPTKVGAKESSVSLSASLINKKPLPLAKPASMGATLPNPVKTLKQAGSKTGEDLDKSFDRKALVDKISQRVEFLYMPTYQNMRRMINKAVRTLAKTSK